MNKIKIVHHKLNFKVDGACRTCAAFFDDEVLIPIFDQIEISTENSLFQIIEELELMNIKIAEDDNLPQQICINCISELKNIHLFRDKCKLAQDLLEQYFIEESLETKSESQTFNKNELIIKNLIKDENDSSSSLVHDEVETNLDFCEENDRFSNVEETGDYLDLVEESFSDNKKFKEDFDVNENSKLIRCEICLHYAYKSLKHLHTGSCTPIQNIFTCFYCSKRFSVIHDVENHIFGTHPEDRPFLCPICNEKFDTGQNCIEHLKELHSDIKRPYFCDMCSGNFRTLRILRRHKRMIHDNGNYECEICHKEFKNIYRFDYHIKSHNKDKPYKCKYCPKSFMQIHHLKDHEATHTGERRYHCKQCDKTFKGTAAYFTHIKTHKAKLYICDICGKQANSQSSLTIHMKQHNNDNKIEITNDKNLYLCSICGKCYETPTGLRVHIKKHNEKIIPNESFKCPSCFKNFASPLGLQNHSKMHDKNRKFKCDLCGLRYTRSEHLQLHMNSEHLKTKIYPCSICDKIFYSYTTRVSHEITHREKNIKCSYCDKMFNRKGAARAHERVHTFEKPNICSICGKRFRSYSAFKGHQFRHTKEELMNAKQKVLTENSEAFTVQKDDVCDE